MVNARSVLYLKGLVSLGFKLFKMMLNGGWMKEQVIMMLSWGILYWPWLLITCQEKFIFDFCRSSKGSITCYLHSCLSPSTLYTIVQLPRTVSCDNVHTITWYWMLKLHDMACLGSSAQWCCCCVSAIVVASGLVAPLPFISARGYMSSALPFEIVQLLLSTDLC